MQDLPFNYTYHALTLFIPGVLELYTVLKPPPVFTSLLTNLTNMYRCVVQNHPGGDEPYEPDNVAIVGASELHPS